MKVSILASTNPGYKLTKDEALKFGGKSAGICYMPDDIEALFSEPEKKTIRRANMTLNSGHHSVFDHTSYNLALEGIPKILAMILNNEGMYTTSEKSARYTKMQPSEQEKNVYEKWIEIYKKEISKVYPQIDEKKVKKLAQESARYLISIFTPATTMEYTVSLRQLNYIAHWFEDYIKNWLESHKGEYTADEAENMIPDLYEKFVTSPCKEAGGKTPEEFFGEVKNAAKLVSMFTESCKEGGACSLLFDRMAEVPECAALLYDLLEKETDPTVIASAMDFLEDSGADQPYLKYAEWLTETEKDESVVEKAAEILKEHPSEEIKNRLLNALDRATEEQKQIIADVLVRQGKDERTYALLKELFLSGKNIPYIAGLIAKYGDERAAEFLYPALDDSNYLEFIEIRNAIETMGGVVDDTYRDFSDDEYYKAIKHLK